MAHNFTPNVDVDGYWEDGDNGNRTLTCPSVICQYFAFVINLKNSFSEKEYNCYHRVNLLNKIKMNLVIKCKIMFFAIV